MWDERSPYLLMHRQTRALQKTSGLGHHWKCGNYAWQKTINKSAFQPAAAAVSCGEIEARRSWSAGVEKREIFREISTLLMNQPCNILSRRNVLCITHLKLITGWRALGRDLQSSLLRNQLSARLVCAPHFHKLLNVNLKRGWWFVVVSSTGDQTKMGKVLIFRLLELTFWWIIGELICKTSRHGAQEPICLGDGVIS